MRDRRGEMKKREIHESAESFIGDLAEFPLKVTPQVIKQNLLNMREMGGEQFGLTKGAETAALAQIPIQPASVEDYRNIVGDKETQQLEKLAKPLNGLRLLQLSSTAFSPRVTDAIGVASALMNYLGLQCSWQVIRPVEEFNQVNRLMYRALEGYPVQWHKAIGDTWLKYNDMYARFFRQKYDIVIVHDHAGLAILSAMTNYNRGKRHLGKWIWSCHRELSIAPPDIWSLLYPHIRYYDAAIFDKESQVRGELKSIYTGVITPAIDPLNPRNAELSRKSIEGVLFQRGIDLGRPIISQVYPLDKAADPLGVIEIYHLVKERIPQVQLILVAPPRSDDMDTRDYFRQLAHQAASDNDLHLLSTPEEVGNVEINAIQQASQVVVQRSVGNGFGLTVADAMWSSRPVVGGRAGGMPLLIIDDETGFLVDDNHQAAERITYLLANPQIANKMGRKARQHIRQSFLITRYVRDYLKLFQFMLSMRE